MRNNLNQFVVGFVVVAFVIIDCGAIDISSLDNNFESGTLLPWIEQSTTGVKWKIENRNSPFEPDNLAPLPFTGTNYLRVDRGTSLAFGVAILRSPIFRIPPGSSNTSFSFSFWIRSKWPQFTNLELYLAKNGDEGLLLNLYEYSDVNNQVWRQSETVMITDDTSSDLTLVFYAYCGTSTEDAVAIDDLHFLTDTILTTPASTATTLSSSTLTPSSFGTDSTSSTVTTTTSSTTSTTAASTATTQTTRPTLTPTKTTQSTRRTLTPTISVITPTIGTAETSAVTGTEGTSAVTGTEETSAVTGTEGTSAETTDSTLGTTLAEEKCPNYLQGDPDVPCWVIETRCYCFYIGSTQQNWTEGNQFCRGGSMTLLSIETLEEDQLIFDHVKSTAEIPNLLYWIAGRYSQKGNDRWEWATNAPFEPITYGNWAVGEPTIKNGTQLMDEYCAYANFNFDFNTGYWIDDSCNAPGFKFVCELNY